MGERLLGPQWGLSEVTPTKHIVQCPHCARPGASLDEALGQETQLALHGRQVLTSTFSTQGSTQNLSLFIGPAGRVTSSPMRGS